jgi:hypothetical protein
VTPADLSDALRHVADLLIPRGDGMPSASDVDVHGTGARRVLATRPELGTELEPLRDRLAACTDPADVRAAAGEGFPALCELVAGAYFTTASVLDALGYPGRPARSLPDLERQERELEALTAPQKRRGPRWRPPEATLQPER